MIEKQPAVYILTNKRNGTLYTGVTSDMIKRIWQHKNNIVESFPQKYSTHLLVWYEIHSTMESAINREKRIKKWNRQWKLDLIKKMNSGWEDLYIKINN
jgi:putative endonuclease